MAGAASLVENSGTWDLGLKTVDSGASVAAMVVVAVVAAVAVAAVVIVAVVEVEGISASKLVGRVVLLREHLKLM